MSGPGKTAPRLIADLLAYDPRYETAAGRNYLTTPPPHYDPSAPPKPAVYERNCRHELGVKPEQSNLPRLEILAHGTLTKIACFCQKCRWHVDVLVDLREHGSRDSPCRHTSTNYLLHHFITDHEAMPSSSVVRPQTREFRFNCSAPICPATLTIRMSPPCLTDEEINLLTNKDLLRERLENARRIAGDRADTQVARPIDGLDFLRTYLRDSLEPQENKNRIPLLNRKFLKTFGKDCDALLHRLGFEYKSEPEEAWILPALPKKPEDARADPNERTFVDDVQHELGALILARPEAERTAIRRPVDPLQPGLMFINRALGCETYQRRASTGTRSASREEDHPYYAGLGALSDFSDSLLLFAFTCQARADPLNGPYYFECIQQIAIGRKSDDLETYVQVLASEGYASRQEVAKAYRILGMDINSHSSESDDNIIGVFRSRLQDISPDAVQEARNALRVIGGARMSEKIRQAASDTIETYDQALSWLGLDEDQTDDFVLSMYTYKVTENYADKEIARKALRIIAQHRRSEQLWTWMDDASYDKRPGMDIGTAYALLNVQDRTERLDLETLRVAADFHSSQNESERAKYEEAYQVICRDQQQRFNVEESSHNVPLRKYPLDTWPVGCRNIGNTCYLNSVLQFLFTIKPLRDYVLDCEQHFQDLSPEGLQAKGRVGRSVVTREQADRAQRFVLELRKLFQQMITANTDHVQPDLKLAALALVPKAQQGQTGNVANLVAQDGPIEPDITASESLPVYGPMPDPTKALPSPPGSASGRVDVDMADAGTQKPDQRSSVDEVVEPNDQSMEIEPESGVQLSTSAPPLHHVQSDEHSAEPMETDSKETGNSGAPKPPSRPPPVPPRPLDAKSIEGLAQQQDAAEILMNVFDMLSCAFEGDGTLLKDDEQSDIIKNMFYSEVTSMRAKDGVKGTSELKDHHLVSLGRRDRSLYAALDDELGSLTEVEDGQVSKYDCLTHLSPIFIVNVRRLLFEGGTTTKDEAHLRLDEVIFLDRYLEQTQSLSAHTLQGLREEQWRLRRTLKECERKKDMLLNTDLRMTLSETVNETADFLQDLNQVESEKLVDTDADSIPAFPDLPNQLRDRAREISEETIRVQEDLKHIDDQISSIFQNCKDYPYRLHAVFMHRGTAKFGHYWIYIWDAQNKVWRRYNDEYVEEVAPSEIYQAQGAATSTSVVYVKADRIEELTEAVHRRPETEGRQHSPQPMQPTSEEHRADVPVINGVEVT
ncbi:cysteine proteinase [Westerdykella ornata]|uniref:ubiquitinyl hydrolase 1 n=1 Tax=Westerdykella ornata TaxID=318751 RepID=A0A6A6JQ54_WESOR|nr:cysteine proteinase [Westerdykella ornata]KAF2278384.1 cysteine proteinase [Westerdykella ornata]